MRKRPRQQRSQQMVEILLEASGRVIERQGLDSLTTNCVAAEAGVSVGSLYQYFANKQELLEALLDRMALDVTRLVDGLLPQLLEADARTAVTILLTEVLAFIRSGNGRYRMLVRHWQQLQALHVVDRLERHLAEACRRYLLRHLRQFPIDNPVPMLFVMINGTLMTLVRYLSLDDPPLSEEELVDGLADMLAAYLAVVAGQPFSLISDRPSENPGR